MEQYADWIWSGKASIQLRGKDSAFYHFSKRLLDTVIAIALLILLSPLMLFIAILIKLDTSGPVIFIQERVGAKRHSTNGRTIWKVENFHFYKFRTMTHGVDQSVHRDYIQAWIEGQVEPNADDSKFKLTNDPRVTRIGHILRKTSLDELPQLLNVLKGEMSLVGPRPVPTYEVAEYQPQHHERLAGMPGITGLWQVEGRCKVTFEEMIRLDIEYLHSQSLWLDIKILFRTIPAVLSGEGAE